MSWGKRVLLVAGGAATWAAVSVLALTAWPRFYAPLLPPRDVRAQYPSHCTLHDVAMVPGAVPILYGFGGGDARSDWAPAERQEFPEANWFHGDGCVVSAISPARATVRFCPACRTAMKDWLARR